MTDAEEKARTYAQLETLRTDKLQVGSTTVSINNIGNIGAFRAGCERGYLAGYAEAMRWRKFPDEVPTKTGEYLVQMDDNDNCGPYFTSHLYSPDCGWSVQVGQSIFYWKEIGELPEGEK